MKRRVFLQTALPLSVLGAAAAAPARNASGLPDWPQARPLEFWTHSAPYRGAVQDVCIGDTRFSAPRGYQAMAYTNLWTLRAEWEADPTLLSRPTFFALEKQRYDLVAPAVIGLGTGGAADGYDARRKLLDCRRPEMTRWLRSEAQRLLAGGYQRAFLDNTMMKVTSFFRPVNPQGPLSDAENVASMAAGLATFRDECARRKRPLDLTINLTGAWHWPGTPRWQDAFPRVLDFWWSLGVRGVLLEKPEARPADSAAYQCNLAFGRAWLARGGQLQVILEDPLRGAALAPAWDSPRTRVLLRKPAGPG